MGWFVYAIYNRDVEKLYIGQTNNLDRRIKEHNQKKGRHFTSGFRGSWEIIYQEQCENRNEAIRREKQLKTFRGREFIKNLINSPVAQR